MRKAARIFLVATLPFVALLTGCPEPEPKTGLSYTADAKRAYDEAMEEFNAHNWIESQTLMREVKKKYAYSKYARLAELRIADADYEQEKYTDAIREYKQFVHDHRSDQDEVVYARARTAEAQYKEINDSILLPTSEERDQAAALESYKELRGFLHDFPDAKEARHVCELLEDVTVKLVHHELYVARFYLARDNFDAAVSRTQYALRNYATEDPCTHGELRERLAAGQGTTNEHLGEFGLAPEALVLLGETYLKMHRWGDARSAFVAVLQRYPESAYVLQAKNFLEFMRDQGV